MSPTRDSTLADPQQLIADLRRELDECRAERDNARRELDARTAERDEALASGMAAVIGRLPATGDWVNPQRFA
jgi:hypothetical protein